MHLARSISDSVVELARQAILSLRLIMITSYSAGRLALQVLGCTCMARELFAAVFIFYWPEWKAAIDSALSRHRRPS